MENKTQEETGKTIIPENQESAASQEETIQSNEETLNTSSEAIQLLEQRVLEAESLATQYKDQLLRKAAEFENYKKRIENDYNERAKYAAEDFALRLLPIVDDFERSLKSGKEMKDFDALYRGIELINQKLLKTLEMKGVAPYSSLGSQFDPHLHDAILQTPKPDVPPHTVIEEVEKGYMMLGKVLRHAKVIVSADTREEQAGQANVEESVNEQQPGGEG